MTTRINLKPIFLISALTCCTAAVSAQVPARPVFAPIGTPITSNLGTFTINGQSGHFESSDKVPLFIRYGEEFDLQSQVIDGDISGRFTAKNGVRVRELDTILRSSKIDAYPYLGAADAYDAVFYQYPYDIKAQHLRLVPDLITAENAIVSTAPPNSRADLEFRAKSLTIDRVGHRIILRDGSIYLFQKRLASVRYFSVPTGGGGGGSGGGFTRPSAGFSQRQGGYIALDARKDADGSLRYGFVLPLRHSVEAYAAAQQNHYLGKPALPSARVSSRGFEGALANLRRAAEITRGALPFGDPLTYHDFIPQQDPINVYDQVPRKKLYVLEEIDYHLASSGHRHDDLQVTRLPEVSFGGVFPLTNDQLPNEGQDGSLFRKALRNPRLVTSFQGSVGEIREDPGNIHDQRSRVSGTLSAEPILIGSDLVLVPSVNAASSFYLRNHLNYSLLQGSLALRKYFNDRTAFEVQYIRSKTSGTSPFNFDTLDTTREMDYRAQVGSHRISLGAAVRYDLSQHSYIDYKISGGMELNGVEPVLQYSFRTRRLGIGIEIPGITF